jgi:hypothetical protein
MTNIRLIQADLAVKSRLRNSRTPGESQPWYLKYAPNPLSLVCREWVAAAGEAAGGGVDGPLSRGRLFISIAFQQRGTQKTMGSKHVSLILLLSKQI